MRAGATPGRRGSRRPRRARTSEPPPAPTVCRSTVGRRIGKPPTSRSATRAARTAGQQADVGGRAAHVEGDRVLEPGAPRDEPRADDAAGRPGDEDRRRVRGRLVDRRDAARGEHHERLGQARLARARPRARAGSAPRPARDTRRPPSSTRARTRGTPARPRARRRRARRDARARSSAATAARATGRGTQKSRQTATASASPTSGSVVEVERLELAVGPDAAVARRGSARAGRAAPAARRTAGRGARASAGAGAGGARSPAFATNAVRAPRRSSSAFVATVVPCAKRSTPAAPTARAAASTDSSCRAAVGTFAVRTRPAVEQDGVGERPADVDAEDRHARTLHRRGRSAPSSSTSTG